MDSTLVKMLIDALNQNSNTVWPAVSAIATIATGSIIFASVFIIRWQLKETRRTATAQGWIFAIQHLQEEEVRMERRRLFDLSEKGIENFNGTESLEWRDLAEKACNRFDSIGVIARYMMYQPEIIIRAYNHSILKTWETTSSFVKEYQAKYGQDYWENFEWLVDQVNKRHHATGNSSS